MTKITVFLIFLIVLVVGYYSYLSGKSRTEQQEAIMSEVDTAPQSRWALSDSHGGISDRYPRQ